MKGETSRGRSIGLKSSSNCEECGSKPWKYKCPGCSIRTCSLPCVQSHKRRTSCTGKKSYAEVVPFSCFDDQLLLSDYRFLEEANRVADSARRWRVGVCGRHFWPHLPMQLKYLKSAAQRRRTKLDFLPSGMSRRKKNKSKFDNSRKAIFWTIEWRLHSAKVVLTNHGVDENRHLKEVFERHLKPGPWKHKLKAFCDEDTCRLKFYLAKNPKGSRPILRELEMSRPIGPQMAGVLIVEYPVIHVYLPSDVCEYEVEKEDNKPFHENPKTKEDPATDSIPSPKGIIFREEEIDDDGCDDTRVIDLIHCLNNQQPEHSTNPEFASPEGVDSHSNSETPGVSFMGPYSERYKPSLDDESCGDLNYGLDGTTGYDFEFEQDLKDAYCDLLGEINTDDFLCLDGILNEGCTEEGTFGDLIEEELEEGEIPS